MKVAVIGANGGIGRLLVTRLEGEKGFEPVAMLRDTSQFAGFGDLDVVCRLGDLEGDFAGALGGTVAVVFTAGSGPHTGKDKTLLVDLWGAVRVIRHCVAHGPRRFLMVSALGADDPDRVEGGLKPYLVAKWAADEILRSSGLDYTILRPGRLTDAPGTGKLSVGADRSGEIPRADVAHALVECLRNPGTVGKTYGILSGATPMAHAFA